jgi:nitronate monooxygenase
VALGEPRWDDDGYDDKLQVVESTHVHLVSFTFGCPTSETVDRMHRAGLQVAVTVTRETTDVPAIGSGGVMTGRDAAAVMGAGAIAVQLGTAFLCTPEAGTAASYREALLSDLFSDTILTRAYSGRFARGLANRFALEHDGQAPQAYPEVHHLTRPLRAAATQAGDTSVPNLWAGTGWRQLTVEPAATIVRHIAMDARSS